MDAPGLRAPTPDELMWGERLCKESGRKSSVQLGRAFVQRLPETQGDPALARLLRHGEVPLKLYLTLVMLTRREPHELFRDTSPEHLAQALGYEGEAAPSGNGTRRVNRALKTLEHQGLIERTRRPGRFPHIKVHHEPEPVMRPPYLTLPLSLWRNGWINVLPAAPLAVYVALRFEAGPRKLEEFHIRPFEKETFALSEDTWGRGTDVLRRAGILQMRKGRADDRALSKRDRTIYRLDPSILDVPPHP